MTDDKQRIQSFLKDCSLEITPGSAESIDNFQEFLRPGETVFVTFLPGSDFSDTIATVKRLSAEGMNPVPHIAARSIPSRDFLERNLEILQTQSPVTEALIIGGSVDHPVGEFRSTMEILNTGLFQQFHINKIGVTGHPEGNPDIPEDDIKTALMEKNNFAKANHIDMYITTQFCFEAEPIIAWEKRLRAQGNELPIHVGIPGLATIKTLLHHARACGIGPSMRVLTRQATDIKKLLTKRMPDKLIRDLATYRTENAECRIAKCHLYPLGGLHKSTAWLYAIKDGNFELNHSGGFNLTVEIN